MSPEERELGRQGYVHIAGADEAGRGAWAGPLVAAAVILPSRHGIRGITDSKQLTPLQREKLYRDIVQKAVAWATVCIAPRIIDERGITYANATGLKRALSKLAQRPDIALIDALPLRHSVIACRSYIRGDARIEIIGAASIIAKVTRDRLMRRYHRGYPAFGFDKHKGYGTAYHQQTLEVHGCTPIHRLSFAPVARIARKTQ